MRNYSSKLFIYGMLAGTPLLARDFDMQGLNFAAPIIHDITTLSANDAQIPIGTIVLDSKDDVFYARRTDGSWQNFDENIFTNIQVDTITDKAGTGSPGFPNGASILDSNIDASGATIGFEKDRSGSVVLDNDQLGSLDFKGYDGTAFVTGAYIRAHVSGTPGTSDLPAKLVFGTTPSGSDAALARLTIAESGLVGIGTGEPDGNLHVQADDLDPAIIANDKADDIIIENTTDSGITIFSGDSNKGHIYFGDAIGSTEGIMTYDHSDDSLQLGTNGNGSRVNIDSDGDLGVGLTSPDFKLDVDGAMAIKDGMSAPTAVSGKAVIFVDSTDGDLKVTFGDNTTKTLTSDNFSLKSDSLLDLTEKVEELKKVIAQLISKNKQYEDRISSLEGK